ncbi:MAG: hypothetical protein ACSLE5_11010 [Porticoccaceae bacterium]
MTASAPLRDTDNVVDIFTGKPYSHPFNRRFIRLAPELDKLEMLYSNTANPSKLFSTRILCWGLREDGEIVGLVPWLDKIVPCTEIQDPLDGQWEGYFDPGIDEVFYEAPIHKALELETAAEYYDYECDDGTDIVQEIPDVIGTHAVFSADGFKTLNLKEVVSWRLLHDGSILGMVADSEKVIHTPVLPGDDSLFVAATNPDFHYYFQHHIANKIKARDPDALAAISILSEP